MKKLKQNEKIAIAVAIPLFLLFFVVSQVFTFSPTITDNTSTAFQSDVDSNGVLGIVDIKVGDGTEALVGTLVTVHYVGAFSDGKVFDSSRDRGEPFQFNLGTGQVISGWDEGIQGMKVGGVRTLVVPPEFAYGEVGFGGVIPPNATLIFEVELLAVDEI